MPNTPNDEGSGRDSGDVDGQPSSRSEDDADSGNREQSEPERDERLHQDPYIPGYQPPPADGDDLGDILMQAQRDYEDTPARDDGSDQDDAADAPWSKGETGFLVEMPDGTLLKTPDGDFEDVGPFWRMSPRGRERARKAIAIGAVAGALGVLYVLFLLFNGGETGTQTLDTTAAPAEETDEPKVKEPEEPVSAVEPAAGGFVAAVIDDCPTGTQPDAIGSRPSPRPGEEAKEVAEVAAVTPVDKAFGLHCSAVFVGSYVFTMIVEGDAETVFVADGTTFDLRFVVNSTWPQNVYEDDTGFTVFVVWNRQAAVYVGRVSGSDGTPVQDATVDIVWLDPSTLEATVTLPGDDIDVRSMRTELLGLIQDAEERTIAQYFDVAIWTAES